MDSDYVTLSKWQTFIVEQGRSCFEIAAVPVLLNTAEELGMLLSSPKIHRLSVFLCLRLIESNVCL